MMGRAIAFVIVAALTVYLVLRLASPAFFSKPTPNLNPSVLPAPAEATPVPILNHSAVPLPAAAPNADPIAPPRTEERRSMEQIEARRVPFYTSLRQNFPYIAAVRPAADDPATLEIYANADDARISLEVVQLTMAPNGAKYGFERVRFYLPNLSGGGGDRYRLDAEATVDKQGVWNTFRK